MRIDKFLWSVRVFKTRNLAAEACKKNRILVNSKPIKASKEVIVSDFIAIRKNQINFSLEVIQIPKSRINAKMLSLYVIDKTNKEEIERLKLLKSSNEYYRNNGTGRPSKKDRREIEDFLDSQQ
ncbi:MAG: RNA-binding S4 domain-containing protein [Solirubrobacteraceae bacterium]